MFPMLNISVFCCIKRLKIKKKLVKVQKNKQFIKHTKKNYIGSGAVIKSSKIK